MKNIGLFLIMVGVLFSSLGSVRYTELDKVDEDSKIIKEDIIKQKINEELINVDKFVITSNFNDKVNNLKNSLNRNDYNNILIEVNSIIYQDVKDFFIDKLKEIDKEITKKEEQAKKYSSKQKLYGKVSAYTPFCSDGCNGYTANGRYVGNNIYYNDKEYGKVRIVAGDKSLPFGTIVRFNNLKYYGKEVYAIVLDRGGAIGFGKRVLFDLLFSSEKEANNFGIEKGIDCDILRRGF